MGTFEGKWTDGGGATITVKESAGVYTLEFDRKINFRDPRMGPFHGPRLGSSRGPFTGVELNGLGSPVVSVNFSDGKQTDAGLQAGVMNFDKTLITWSNQTVWKKS